MTTLAVYLTNQTGTAPHTTFAALDPASGSSCTKAASTGPSSGLSHDMGTGLTVILFTPTRTPLGCSTSTKP